MAKQKFGFLPSKTESPNEVSSIQNVVAIKQKLEEPSSEIKTDKFEVRLIPRNKIIYNPFNRKNNFEMSAIDQLKSTILNYGLAHNLTAIYSLEDDNYILESGHRRTMALDSLIEEYSNYNGNPESEDYKLYLKNVSAYEKGYPVKICDKLEEDLNYDDNWDSLPEVPESILESEIRVHITNMEIRNETPSQRAEHIQRLGHLYDERNRRHHKNNKFNVNKTIGEKLGISDRHVADMRATENLIPELQNEFEKNNIILKDAAGYGRLDKELQYAILEIIQKGDKVSKEEIKVLRHKQEEAVAEKEKLTTEIQNKQQELDLLRTEIKNKNSSQTNEEAEELKKQKQMLEAEIKKIKKQQSLPLLKLNSTEANALKYDLSLKELLASAKNNVTKLNNAINDFKQIKDKLSADQCQNLSLISEEDIILELESIISDIKQYTP